MTLREIEQQMLRKSIIKQRADFVAPDGTRYALSSTFSDLLRMPFFRMRLDNMTEYHVQCDTAISKQYESVAQTASEREFQKMA